jgi:hypothetical protein
VSRVLTARGQVRDTSVTEAVAVIQAELESGQVRQPEDERE